MSQFPRRKSSSSKKSNTCKICGTALVIAHRRTQAGLLGHIYSNQKSTSKTRGHASPDYTKEELYDWATAQTVFHVLFGTWERADFESKLSPSCDRINDSKPYTLDNIKLMTWDENQRKSQIRAVNQYDLAGSFIVKHISITAAAKAVNGRVGNIGYACKGKIQTAYKFKWSYA